MTNIYNSCDIQNVIAFLRQELFDEKYLMMNGEENHYSYLSMILNDIGITID